MSDGKTAGSDDVSQTLEDDLARCRGVIAALISDVGSIQKRHPKLHDALFDVIGTLQEADELIEDLSNN
jgi:hypothetical protein